MRGLRGSLTVLSLVAASELHAESPGIPALNRYFGLGWGDGYHVSSAGCPGQACCQSPAMALMPYGVPMQPTPGGVWAPAPAAPAANSWGAPAFSAPPPAAPTPAQALPDPRTGFYAPRHVYPGYRVATGPVVPAGQLLVYPAPIMQPVQMLPPPTVPVAPRVAQSPGFRVSIP